MSASTRVARRALVGSPFTGPGRVVLRSPWLVTSSPFARRWPGLHNKATAALLIPLRNLGTDTSTHGNGLSSGPPPGFDPEKAKTPMPRHVASSSNATGATATATKTTTTTEAGAMESEREIGLAAEEKGASPTQLAAQQDKAVANKEGDGRKENKLTLMQKIKRELRHYWDGTKLLATEVSISSKLALRMTAGYELTRREQRQLKRTVQDLGRLVPFSMFVIIPFAELLLPVALKLFPNLLPSTYEGQQSKEKKASVLRASRKEVSDFLRTSMKETGLPLTPATTHRQEFINFFRKLRGTGQKPTAEDVIKVCRTFRDDLTLDNLSRPQLVSMCRYLNLNTFGTDTMLRYQIRHRMRQIKRDDRAISYEGVDSLTVSELQTACGSRGIRTHGVSPARLREDLQTWMDLRLRDGVPSTLLVLSNAYMYSKASVESDASNLIDALMGVLSSIPEELFHEIELEVHNAEGSATNKQRLEVLKEQQELIEEEMEQNQENQDTGFATPRDTEDIDEKEDRPEVDAAPVDTAQPVEASEAEKDRIAAAPPGGKGGKSDK